MPTRSAKARTGTVRNRDANRAMKNAKRPAAIRPQISELRIRPGRLLPAMHATHCRIWDPAPKSKTRRPLGGSTGCPHAAAITIARKKSPGQKKVTSAFKIPKLSIKCYYSRKGMKITEPEIGALGTWLLRGSQRRGDEIGKT